MNKEEIAIIVVNMNGRHLLEDCLSSLRLQSYSEFELYFVDNNSFDDSVAFARKIYPEIKVIQFDKNYGFAKANNVAIKQALDAGAKYIICLNNDTKVDKEWLFEMITAAKSDKTKKIGMVASKSYFPDFTIQNAGIKIIYSNNFYYKEAVARGSGVNDNQDNEFNTTEYIFGPSGNSALYTRELLEEVGMFDEDFFAYMEDVDLALRAQKRGYLCLYNPKSKLLHYHSQTSKAASPFKAFYSKRNLYYMAIKNFSVIELMLFPFRDLFWNIEKYKTKKKDNSVKELKKNIGKFGLMGIMLKVYLNVFLMLPRLFFKRWKTKKI